MGTQQHISRHFRIAAKLAAQRPLGSGTIGEDAAEHPSPRRGAGYLLNFFNAIHRKHGNAIVMRARNIALFLDGIAE
jgi:hypothetical protein